MSTMILRRPLSLFFLWFGLLACNNTKRPNTPMPTTEKREVYCLDVALSWNGQPIEGGRLPVYGAEVPNVSRTKEQERQNPTRSQAIRPGGQPLLQLESLFLNNSSQSIHFLSAPNLPLEEGALEVTLSLRVCPARKGGWPKELLTTAKEATRMVRFCEPVPSWEGSSLLVSNKEQFSAELSPGHPVASHVWKVSGDRGSCCPGARDLD